MTLWWAGNLVLAAAVFPVVAVLASRVLRRTAEIDHLAGRVAAGADRVAGELAAVPKLQSTGELTGSAAGLAVRYADSVERLL